jgi:hypothetical protein
MVKKVAKPGFCSKCFLRLFIISIILFITQAVFIFGKFFHDSIYLHNIFSNLFLILFALICFVASWLIYKKIPETFPREKKATLFFMLFVLFFLFGDILWFVYETLFGQKIPLGSLPDLSWAIGYFFLIISVVYFAKIGFRSNENGVFVALAIGILLSCFLIYYDVSEDLAEGSFDFTHFLQDMYIVYDLIVLLLIIYVVWPLLYSGVKYGMQWIILSLGIVIRLVYDFIFAEISANGSYFTGHPIDLLYVLLYILIILSFYVKAKLMETTKQ